MDIEIKTALDGIGDQVKQAIAKYEGQVKDAGSAAVEVKAEVVELSERFAEMNRVVSDIAQKQTAAPQTKLIMSAGEEFTKSEQFKQLVAGNVHRARLEVKNTVVGNSTTVFPAQVPGIIPGDFKPLTIRDLFRVIPVSTNMVNSLREATNTNSAAEVAEAAAKAESAVTFEQYNVPITTVAHWLKVSNQLLADAPAIVAYIETRLRDGLAQRIDLQLLNGDGNAPNISGLTDAGNFTAYTATAADLLTDAINRAKYALWALGHVPDAVIVNPADWGAMERKKETTGDYLYGMPGMAAGVNPFGVRVVLSSNMAAGSFWIGATNTAAVLYARSGAIIEMGYVNADFTNNLVTIRAEERLGLGVEKPTATLYGAFTA